MNVMAIERALRRSGMTTAAHHLDIVQRARCTTKVDDPGRAHRRLCLRRAPNLLKDEATALTFTSEEDAP
jgi:hypothetical protein